MEEMKKNELTEQERKDVELLAQLPEFAKALLLERARGMLQGAEMTKKLAG